MCDALFHNQCARTVCSQSRTHLLLPAQWKTNACSVWDLNRVPETVKIEKTKQTKKGTAAAAAKKVTFKIDLNVEFAQPHFGRFFSPMWATQKTLQLVHSFRFQTRHLIYFNHWFNWRQKSLEKPSRSPSLSSWLTGSGCRSERAPCQRPDSLPCPSAQHLPRLSAAGERVRVRVFPAGF